MFQDGSDAAIRTPTTSARGVVTPPTGGTGRPFPGTARGAPSRPAPRRRGRSRPRRAGPRRTCERPQRSPRSPPDCRTSGPYALRAGARSHLPRRPPSRKQPPLAGSPRKCRTDAGAPDGTSGAFRPPPPAGTPRRLLSPTRSRFSRIRFPPNGFAVFLTLFSKYFSPFPHGTCSLSVSCRYLALDGVYHPLWAAFPNNPTLRRQWQPGPAASLTGLSPSPTCLSRSTSTAPTRDNGCLSRPQFSDARRRGFQARALPTSLAVTEGILVSFSSSAY